MLLIQYNMPKICLDSKQYRPLSNCCFRNCLIWAGVILELSEREKFCDNIRISGRSFGPNFGFPYTFLYIFTSPSIQDREKSASLPNCPLRWPLIWVNTFLAHLSSAQDELLWSLFIRRPCVRPCVRPSCQSMRPSVNIFKRLLLWNRWANFAQISYGASLGWGNERLLKWSRSVDQDGCHAHIW